MQRIVDNDRDYVDPQDMLAELRENSMRLTANMRPLKPQARIAVAKPH